MKLVEVKLEGYTEMLAMKLEVGMFKKDKLFIGYWFCSWYGRSFNKCVRGGVGVGVGGSIGWGVDICVGFVFGGADGIIFGIDDWYDMSYSHLYFYV